MQILFVLHRGIGALTRLTTSGAHNSVDAVWSLTALHTLNAACAAAF